MDFYEIRLQNSPGNAIKVYPDYKTISSKDLMIRGGSFYAIWDERINAWNTNAFDAIDIIDADIREHVKELQDNSLDPDKKYKGQYLRNFNTGQWKKFRDWASNCPDNFVQLDSTLTFANSETKREDYSSKRLPYPLEPGDHSAWDELVGTLYAPEERQKIEWAIGSIVAGEAKDIQKFMVFYGKAGAGKSTILNIIAELFDGYWTTFSAAELASKNATFSTAPFKNNPLVAIQQDGDLSLITDNSKLNSLVSHEEVMIRDLYQSAYAARVNCFVFMGTNKPVKITDAKSGLIRRLIDVHPSNNLIPRPRYNELINRIKFELGAIAWYCLEVYKSMGSTYYDAYKPLDMMYQTDAFYNFVESNYDLFKKKNGISMNEAWMLYKEYCDEALIDKRLVQYKFREELKNYFAEYKDYIRIDGKQIRKYYSGFLANKFDNNSKVETFVKECWLKFNSSESLFDDFAADFKAQLANEDEKPISAWSKVKTTLKEIDTSKLHYVRVPIDHIVIDFDIRDEHGSKSYERNLEAASKFPPTYAELSKSGAGIHLHYNYKGDIEKLKSIYAPDIEVKVFKGKASLRRKLVKCNDIPIATISSGLPLKEEEAKVFDAISIKNEKHLRNKIAQALRKEVEPGKTITCVQYIKDVLDKAYAMKDFTYDVSDLRDVIYAFACNSTHNPGTCVDMYTKMHFMSKDHERSEVVTDIRFAKNAPRVFFDIESLPNLFLICWKVAGPNEPVHAMINPSKTEVYDWIWNNHGELRYRLVGFNNKHYDNPMIMGVAMNGDTPYESFMRSQGIIGGNINMIPRGSKNISETDVLDFASDKKGLKKWEIELGLPHKELPWPWDKPIPDEMINEVVKYCTNDVIQTEAVFEHLHEDFRARQMLAKGANVTINNSTNDLTAQFVFGDDKEPQKNFNYRFMGDIPNDILILNTDTFEFTEAHGMTAEELIEKEYFSVFDMEMRPVFPGYKFNQFVKAHKSEYRGEDPKEGGYVYAERGMYSNVALLDIASMHPSSIVAENLFGDKYTKRFKDILDLRLHIKHKEFEMARDMLDGVFAEYLDNESTAKQLSKTLKIPINAVYGQTSASFKNRFKDPRNIDNIVAKRGALFMINLKHEVQKRGFTVAHIKTDSIKIPDATPEIIEFVNRYGKVYGYNFEHEATYDRMCLVNNAVYIAKYKFPEKGVWTATGAQFAQPYVFKKLFSKEPIEFKDLCETKAVTSAMYLDMNEKLPDVEALEKEYKKKQKKDPAFKDEQMEAEIAKGHNYVFIGKVGQYCPIKPGANGGILVREGDGKYDAVAGTIGYRWLESDVVKSAHKENDIDMSYFERLADAAVNDISKYGDFTWFVSDDTQEELIDINSDELPF